MVDVTGHSVEPLETTAHSVEPLETTAHSVEPPETTEHSFEATRSSGVVSALLTRPANADCLLVFAHGAGAGMRHPFMETLAARLADRRIATFRYQFPYVE